MTEFFSKNLKFLRQQKGLSQQELADKMKVDRSTISRWESGMDVTVGNAMQVSNALNVSVDELLSKDMSSNNNTYDEIDVLYDKYKDVLPESSKNIIKAIIVEEKKKIDEQLDGKK